MGLTRCLITALVALAGTAIATSNKIVVVKTAETTTSSATILTPCVATSTSGAFYDLRPDIVVVPVDGAKPAKGAPTEDYLVRGHDYGSNFTLNICAAVVKTPEDAIGISSSALKNVSAYYQANGKTYSLGQESSTLISRGRRLVLQYTDGSPCGSDLAKRGTVHSGANSKGYQDEEKDYIVSSASSKGTSGSVKGTLATERRKSATISFLCDPDPLNTEASVSFVDKDPYECAYFFEVRSHHACPGVEPQKPGSLGPGSVFAIILLIAVLVYVVGGIFYQRTVAHARGWRQLPNYSLWLGIWNFLKDIFMILIASCARYLPSRRGYRSLAISPTRRIRDRESENRLIDQLDEEWDD